MAQESPSTKFPSSGSPGSESYNPNCPEIGLEFRERSERGAYFQWVQRLLMITVHSSGSTGYHFYSGTCGTRQVCPG